MSGFDLDAYCARIGHDGPRVATLETLQALHRLHPAAIAFENIDPFTGVTPNLEIAALQDKLVHGGRGGYCFEQNTLMRAALEALGFSVRGLAGRVVWNMPQGALTPRGHMALHVEAGGHAYLCDVGFGGLTMTAPLKLEAGLEQQTPHETFRLTRDGDGFFVEAKVGEAWGALYRFDLQEHFAVDYGVTNYYLANHPRSLFRNTCIAARALPDRRHALRGDTLTTHHRDGRAEKRVLVDAADARATLKEVFSVTPPDAPAFDAAFERMKAAQALS